MYRIGDTIIEMLWGKPYPTNVLFLAVGVCAVVACRTFYHGVYRITRPKDSTMRSAFLSMDEIGMAPENHFSFCRLQERLAIPHFESQNDVYVGFAEDQNTMQQLLDNIPAELSSIQEVVSVVGGMSALHLFPHFDVTSIKRFRWIDVNCHALDNAQLILELVKGSSGRRDFISRVFARDLGRFLRSNNYLDLDVVNQQEYMAMRPDPQIVDDVVRSLPPKLGRLYLENIAPRAHNGPLSTNVMANQHILSPILEDSTRPLTRVGVKGAFNKGSLDYGFGFMGSDLDFNKTKSILLHTKHTFSVADLVQTRGRVFLSGTSNTLLYMSNVLAFDSNPIIDSQEMIIEWWKPFFLHNRSLRIVSAHPLPDFGVPEQNQHYLHISKTSDPHINAFYWLTSTIDIGSNVVEIMKKDLLPGGMREFPRTAVSVEAYTALEKCEARTTLLHILVGEGAVGKQELIEVFNRALKQSLRVIIMEWDATSADHRDKLGLFTPQELVDLIGKQPSNQFHIPGVLDDKRIFVLEYKGQLEPSLFFQPTCSVGM